MPSLFSPDGWSEEGCHVVESKSSSGQTECSCNHMTHFAVLVDYGGNIEVIFTNVQYVIFETSQLHTQLKQL